jgi:hypothetical protein
MEEKWFKVAAIAASVVVIGGETYFLSQNYKNTDAKIVTLESKKNDLEIQLKNVENATQETKETVSSKLKTAVDAGRMVARLQNKYTTFDHRAKEEELEKNAADLRKYFTSNTSNAGVPWLSYVRGINTESLASPNWEFVTTYGFNPGKVDTLWLNKDLKTGVMYAYTTAIYDTETGLFSQVKKVQTSYAGALVDTNAQDTRTPGSENTGGEN